jgi:hypothetical protein
MVCRTSVARTSAVRGIRATAAARANPAAAQATAVQILR